MGKEKNRQAADRVTRCDRWEQQQQQRRKKVMDIYTIRSRFRRYHRSILHWERFPDTACSVRAARQWRMESGDKDSGRKRKGQMKAKEKKEEEEEEPMSISAVHFVDPVVRWAHLISSARPVVAPSDSSIGARFVNSPVRDRPDLCLSLCLALFFFFFF